MINGAVFEPIDQAIEQATPEDRPALVVALAARLATLGAGLMVPTQSGSGTEDRALTLPEVADVLGVSSSYVYELARRRRLPIVHLPGTDRVGGNRTGEGKYVRVMASSLRSWLAEHENKELDSDVSQGLRLTYDRRESQADPEGATAHTAAVRKARRRPSGQRRTVGDRDTGSARNHGEVDPAPDRL